jgi:hypothetical protein
MLVTLPSPSTILPNSFSFLPTSTSVAAYTTLAAVSTTVNSLVVVKVFVPTLYTAITVTLEPI